MKTVEQAKRPKRATETQDLGDWTWGDPKSLKVNPDFERLIPLQSKGELLALRKSIEEEGCRDPLLVWKGHNVVLDGHTRRDLCAELKKQVKVREVELADEAEATKFILQLQRQRRNLTREAMCYLRGVEYNAVKQSHGGSRRGRKPKGQNDPLNSTALRLAEGYGVSEKTIKRDGVFAQVIDKIVEDYGDPKVRRKLLGADVRLTHGLAKFLYKKPSEERKALVSQLVEQGELPRAKKKAISQARQAKEVAASLVNRLKSKGEDHARAVLGQMARLLGMEVAEKAPAG